MLNKDFLSLFDMDREELETLFLLADELKLSSEYRPLAGTTTALFFQKPSFRTRVSFEVGVQQLGGQTVNLPDDRVGIGTRESVYDVVKLLSRYVDVVVARVFDHALLEEMSAHGTIPIINALTDLSHPCQIISDMYTLREHGRLRPGLRVGFIGDGNNVVNSWLEMTTLYPINFVLAAPEGYDPDPTILARSREACVGSIEIVRDPNAAADGADVIYSDVFTSMGHEAEQEARRTAFNGYRVDAALMSRTASDAVFMHCLPAHRGEEVTAEVIDGNQSIIFDQAENRLHMQKALLARLVDRARSLERALHVHAPSNNVRR